MTSDFSSKGYFLEFGNSVMPCSGKWVFKSDNMGRFIWIPYEMIQR